MSQDSVRGPSKMPIRLLMIGLLILILIAGALIIVFVFNRSTAPSDAPNVGPALVEGETSDGVTIYEPPEPVQDFTLTSQLGTPFSLSDERGKLVLLFFGYTNCPDVCPMTMLEYKQIKNKLGADADQVAFVFVSVDGERDTPEVLADFLSRFDPDFIGLTGQADEINAIGKDYNLYYEKQYGSGSQAEYLVIHTANTFLLDREGRLTRKFPFGTDADVVAEHIRNIL